MGSHRPSVALKEGSSMVSTAAVGSAQAKGMFVVELSLVAATLSRWHCKREESEWSTPAP